MTLLDAPENSKDIDPGGGTGGLVLMAQKGPVLSRWDGDMVVKYAGDHFQLLLQGTHHRDLATSRLGREDPSENCL